MAQKKIMIIGGGLAGLTTAIHLTKQGIHATLIEKEDFPKHKVCGEYISNEVLPYWCGLGIDPFAWGAVAIDRLALSTASGKCLETILPLGGFGISRFFLDHKLYDNLLQAGCSILKEQVTKVKFNNNIFRIETQSGKILIADLVIGAQGKRSGLDISLSRKFINNKTPWLGVKSHYQGDWNSSVVGLHNFKGGYCGISKVENDRINVCYLAHQQAFGKHKNLDDFRERVLRQNPVLDDFFAQAIPLFKKPLTISQISFDPKECIVDHVLMCGDSASLIHPLCGNGMAMAIEGARILSESIIDWISTQKTRIELEQDYARNWERKFKTRLRAGRRLQWLLTHEGATNVGLRALKPFPGVFKRIISTTHGIPRHT